MGATTQVTTQVNNKEESTFEKLIGFCNSPRSTREIAEYLGFKERKSATKYIRKLMNQGRIAITNPDNPTISNQKYITVKWQQIFIDVS